MVPLLFHPEEPSHRFVLDDEALQNEAINECQGAGYAEIENVAGGEFSGEIEQDEQRQMEHHCLEELHHWRRYADISIDEIARHCVYDQFGTQPDDCRTLAAIMRNKEITEGEGYESAKNGGEEYCLVFSDWHKSLVHEYLVIAHDDQQRHAEHHRNDGSVIAFARDEQDDVSRLHDGKQDKGQTKGENDGNALAEKCGIFCQFAFLQQTAHSWHHDCGKSAIKAEDDGEELCCCGEVAHLGIAFLYSEEHGVKGGIEIAEKHVESEYDDWREELHDLKILHGKADEAPHIQAVDNGIGNDGKCGEEEICHIVFLAVDKDEDGCNIEHPDDEGSDSDNLEILNALEEPIHQEDVCHELCHAYANEFAMLLQFGQEEVNSAQNEKCYCGKEDVYVEEAAEGAVEFVAVGL